MRKRQNTDDLIKLVFKNRNTVNKDLQNYSNSLFFNNESGKGLFISRRNSRGK